MRVAIDTRRADWAANTGIGRYVRELVRALERSEEPTVVPVSSSRASFVHPLRKIAHEQVAVLAASRRADLFHAPYYEVSPLCGRRLILNVHDLDTLEAPERYSARVRFYNNRLLRGLLHRARQVIVPSQYTRDRLEAHLAIGEKVEVTPYGVEEAFFRPAKDSLVEPPFVLYTGGTAWRKNLPTLLGAFAHMTGDGYPGRLVITGRVRNGALPPGLVATLGDRLVVTGVVPDDDLVDLYGNADALLYPSDLEGFGFPVLEAFAAGCPVICSRAGSLPELADDAAILLEEPNARELADSTLSLLADDTRRGQLATLGRQRAATFTWERTAAQTRDCYERALA